LGTEHVQIEAGYWADRQRINREETLLAGHRQLERTGTLDNLRIAAGRLAGTFRGLVFVDSDVYKWLEAVSWELARGPTPELARLAAETIDVIAAAQQEDGYLNSYYQIVAPDRRFTDPQMGHELYCAGHLIQAAVAHARATGSTALLQVAVRFADYLDDMFGPGRRPYLEGHPEIEMALVELYRLTGRERYLKLAGHFIDQRGYGLVGPVSFGAAYYQDHRPVRDASTVTGHAVRALYLCAGVTDAYLETGDETLLAAQVRQWDDMARFDQDAGAGGKVLTGRADQRVKVLVQARRVVVVGVTGAEAHRRGRRPGTGRRRPTARRRRRAPRRGESPTRPGGCRAETGQPVRRYRPSRATEAPVSLRAAPRPAGCGPSG
jgi:hypothetical protein